MKDIDFDELDKAVNSLMSSTPGDVSEAPASPPVEPEVSPVVEPVVESPAATPITPTPPADKPAVKPGVELTKRTGRFMDVVHPSSDMRSASSATLPKRKEVSIVPPSRSAGVIEPVEPSTTKPIEAPEVLEAPKEDTTKVSMSRAFSFPDPLELVSKMQGKRTDDQPEPTQPIKEEKELTIPSTTEESDTNLTPAEESTESLQSLFLPDVKVEKRPLGVPTSGDDTTPEDAGMPAGDALDIDDMPSGKTDPLATPDPMLAELGKDVLAIESDTSSTTDSKETETVDTTRAAKEEYDPPVPESNAIGAAAVSSIPRQYSVKASTSDDKHHEALYDAAAQTPAPLQHPAAKKSGWLVVLWVALLIAVGVGGALALYFLKVF